MYVDNTNCVGIKFTSFIGGEKESKYQSGEKFPMKIFVDNEVHMEFNDFYWSVEDYISMLKEAGFDNVTSSFPTPTKNNMEKRGTPFLKLRSFYSAPPRRPSQRPARARR